ncbi:MAG: DNA/RNA nuclease SfsA [Bacteriovoracaceae bacterium]|nr:DNA/RNA nuclease SfsA [Bacteriovoracaceae bacterium]
MSEKQMVQYTEKLLTGTISNRYKRFLSDITLDNGEEINAHVPNTGSMKTCWGVDWKVAVSFHDNPKRKLKYTLEMTHNGKTWIGTNTHLTNKLAFEAVKRHLIKELSDYDDIKKEVKIGDSRIDLLLTKGDKKCYVEVKNVTLDAGDGLVTFPDSVTTRGQKHLRELTQIVKNGDRACMLYIVQREDVDRFAPAFKIDPEYAKLLTEAHKAGVEILVYRCKVTPKEVVVDKQLHYTLTN